MGRRRTRRAPHFWIFVPSSRALSESYSFFEALVILDPLSVYDFQTLGGLYLQISENTKALYVLDQALRMQGDHLPTLLNKTKALFCLGRIEEASAIASYLRRVQILSLQTMPKHYYLVM